MSVVVVAYVLNGNLRQSTPSNYTLQQIVFFVPVFGVYLIAKTKSADITFGIIVFEFPDSLVGCLYLYYFSVSVVYVLFHKPRRRCLAYKLPILIILERTFVLIALVGIGKFCNEVFVVIRKILSMFGCSVLF